MEIEIDRSPHIDKSANPKNYRMHLPYYPQILCCTNFRAEECVKINPNISVHDIL